MPRYTVQLMKVISYSPASGWQQEVPLTDNFVEDNDKEAKRYFKKKYGEDPSVKKATLWRAEVIETLDTVDA